MLMIFVRRGWDEGDGGGAQRVGYRYRDGQIERLSYRRVDGGAGAAAVRLAGGVRAVRLRYRDRDGAWLARWDPNDGTRLPVAVELVADSTAHGLVRQVFVVGSPR